MYPWVNNKLWLISDTHFGHKNIVQFQQRPESHEAIMLSNWIDKVMPYDSILHLGDVFLGPPGNRTRWANILSILPGSKYLILGNHDGLNLSLFKKAGFTVVDEFIKDGYAFTHRPTSEEHPGPKGDFHTNIHGHVHGNPFSVKHDGHLLDKKFINMCVEVRGFSPVRLGNVWKQPGDCMCFVSGNPETGEGPHMRPCPSDLCERTDHIHEKG